MVASPTAPKQGATFSKEDVVKIYREMLVLRRFEERMAQLYQQGKISGFCHLYIGQEAVAMAAHHACRPDDYMITSYRDHAHPIVKGMDPLAVAAELCGKEIGCAKGKGGSMHMFDVARGFYGGHGIVGGQIPVATGMAFGSKYQEDDRVTMCFFGEAAVNQGTFHESLNMASLWHLPIVYICENNRYGMGTAIERAHAVTELSHRTACAYDIEGVAVDGMDFFATYECFKKAADKARTDFRPTFVDCKTYRFRGHSMSDPVHSHYRTKEEVEEMRGRDPITLLVKYIEENDYATLSQLETMDEEVKEEMKEMVQKALEAKEPPLESRFKDIYV